MSSERQIRLIQERLRGIETSIGQLASSATIAEPPDDHVHSSLKDSLGVPRRDDTAHTAQSTAGFEGNSSFASSALLAENVAERTSEKDARMSKEHEMAGALKNLKSTLEQHRPEAICASQMHCPSFKYSVRAQNLELLPVAFAVVVAKRFKGTN